MGYRSQVYVGVPPTKGKELESFEWEYGTTHKSTSTFLELFKPVKRNWDEGMFIYVGDWLKWYEGYKDVIAITNFVQECEGFIVAIGEDDAVHSALGDYYEYIDIRMQIDIL